MKKIILTLIFLLIPILVLAGECETITVSNTAIGLTLNVYTAPNGTIASEGYCCNETAQIRVKYDNDTSPTSTVGIIVNSNSCIRLNQQDLADFKAIRTGASDATLTCCYSW